MSLKINISSVSYLNTKPFLHGLYKTGLINEIDLHLEIPSKTAEKLKNGIAQIGLVPVAILPQLQQAKIITDYCIGAIGEVKTVALYSQVPLNQIQKIYLDYQSCTSVQLVQILCKEHWKLTDIEFVPAQENFEQNIKGNTAGVIIGDRTIEWAPRFAYSYDLSEAWYQFTGLPFVFAAWVTTQDLPEGFETLLNQAFKTGLQSIEEVVLEFQPKFDKNFDVREYFTRYISYEFDVQKKLGLELFLSYVRQNTAIEIPSLI